MFSYLRLAQTFRVQTLTNNIWDPHSVYHTVSPTVFTCKAAGTVAPVLAEIAASYGDAHRVLYQVGGKKNHKKLH